MNGLFDVLIFSKAPKAYEPTCFYEEAEKRSLKVKVVSYPRIDFEIKKEEIRLLYEGGSMPQGKFIIFRAAGGDNFYIPQRDFLLNWYLGGGGKVLNSETYLKWSRLDKITQHFEFQKGELPFVKSLNFGASRKIIETLNEFPVIAKHNLSSQGRDVYKLESKKDSEKLLESYKARTLLIQPFLTSGEDLRVIVIAGKAIGAMKRIAKKGSYLTNYSAGGEVVNYDLSHDPEAVELAEKVSFHFLTDYVGVDLMKDGEGIWRVLEVNRSCQFKGFQTATGINVPSKVFDFLLTKS